jgi:hypothetical protein
MNKLVRPNSDDLNTPLDSVNRILTNLEQMHPQYLASLLRSGDLGKVIRRRVDWYERTMATLQEALPNEPYASLDEKARDCLGGTNLDWQNEKPLTWEEVKLLEEFRAAVEEYRCPGERGD